MEVEVKSEEPELIKSEVHTVVLQNVCLEGDDITITNGDYLENNSDGNLRIENIQFIIQSEDPEQDGVPEGTVTEIWNFTDYEEVDQEDEPDCIEEGENILEGVIEENSIVITAGDDENSQEMDIVSASASTSSSASDTEEVNYDKDEENVCDLCSRIFKTTAGLKRHIAVVHSNEEKEDDPLTFQLCLCCGEPSDTAHKVGELKCDECDKLFVLQSSLERHCSIEHVTGNVYKCIDCLKILESKEKLMEHSQIHPICKFTCKECNRDFTRKYHLERHIMQVGCNGVTIVEYTCQVCKKIFRRRDNLREHLKMHAGECRSKKLFSCLYCQKTFHGSALLNIHVRTHTGEKPYPCDFCEKRFPSSGAAKKHRRLHTGEKPYECQECKTRFSAKETLNRHMRIHSGNKPHVCHFCGKSFIQATQLRAHIFHHTGENAYVCPHCNRAFNRKLRLTTHIKYVHEGAKPLECKSCDKTFFRKEDLSRHAISHTGQKPFACEVCDKAFAVKSSLKIHMNTHRKEPPCSCQACGRAFIRQDCLLRHIRARHRDMLEDIMAAAEKRRLQQQLLSVVSNSTGDTKTMENNVVWNELTLTESIKELLTLLVDEQCLKDFGYPDAPVDKVLDSVIKRCGHKPASEEDFDYLGRIRENAKLLFTVVIDDETVKELLNNQTVDEVIMHVLRLARNQEEKQIGTE